MPASSLSLHSALLAALALAAGSAAHAVQSFGSGCAGHGGLVPTVAVLGTPVQGQSIQVQLGGAPGTPSVLLVGASQTAYQALALPFDLGVLSPGLAGCSLVVSIDLRLDLQLPASGTLTSTYGSSTIPAGVPLYLQHWNLDLDLVGFTNLGGWSAGLEFALLPPSGVSPGDLVITEFLKDPSHSPDSSGEWIELYNRTAQPIDLAGYRLSDGNFDLAVLQSEAPILVPPGGYAVLGNGSGPAVNGGVQLDFSYSGFFLGNAADQILLTTYDGILVDALAYDNGVAWPDSAGRSIALAPGVLDAVANDDPAHWSHATCFIGGAPFNTDQGTPGVDNGSCATPALPSGTGRLLITELQSNPAAVSDANGEYLEVHNPGAALDLLGWTVCTADVCETIGSSLLLPAGGYLTLATNGNSAENGGLPGAVWALTAGQFLPNGGGSVQLVDPASNVAALLIYASGGAWPVPNGASLSLDPGHFDAAQAQLGANWCLSTTPYGLGDKGTPGAANLPCP